MHPPLAVTAATLAILAAATRFGLQDIHTRYQIVGFCLIAVAIEIVACILGSRPRFGRWVVHAVVVTTAITATKIYLEGVSPRIEKTVTCPWSGLRSCRSIL